ncbi:MAG: WD40 repeat domain-containing protein [Ktedonobacteraceae bacterium]|nr:WD40 repeat domain-containing protein [Ktedonobacteraceae bacterium]
MPGIKPFSRRILDPASRQRWLAQLDDHIQSLAWSPDGTRLAAASVSGPIALFAAHTGQVTHTLDGHRFGTCEIAWDHTGKLLASVGQDGNVRIWQVEQGQALYTLEGGASWVEHLAWHPHRPLLATAAGRKARLWDGSSGQMIQEYPAHQSTVSDVQWSPDGASLVTAAYGGLNFWQPEQHEPQRHLTWKGSILVISWSPNGRFIATGDQDATVHFWTVKSGQDLQMYGYPTKVRELSWDGASRYLATGGGDAAVVWDCSGKGPAGSRPIELAGKTDQLSALAFQHRGPLIAAASIDGTVIFWRIDRPQRPLERVRFDGEISQLVWSPDDRLVAIGTSKGLVTIYTPPTVR